MESSRKERKIVTVLFADLVGFTARAEQLDPEDVEAILRPYHERLRSELERLAYSLNAPVSFIGNLDHSAVAAALAAADVVAVPSVVDSLGNVDGLPNVLLEALSTGRPVVASAIAGIPEVVTDRSNGILVPEKNVDSLRRALTELAQPGLRAELGREARRRAVAELEWDPTAQAFESAFVVAGARAHLSEGVSG